MQALISKGDSLGRRACSCRLGTGGIKGECLVCLVLQQGRVCLAQFASQVSVGSVFDLVCSHCQCHCACGQRCPIAVDTERAL